MKIEEKATNYEVLAVGLFVCRQLHTHNTVTYTGHSITELVSSSSSWRKKKKEEHQYVPHCASRIHTRKKGRQRRRHGIKSWAGLSWALRQIHQSMNSSRAEQGASSESSCRKNKLLFTSRLKSWGWNWRTIWSHPAARGLVLVPRPLSSFGKQQEKYKNNSK